MCIKNIEGFTGFIKNKVSFQHKFYLYHTTNYFYEPETISYSCFTYYQELVAIDALIAWSEFTDGKLTASMAAKELKNNLQIASAIKILQP